METFVAAQGAVYEVKLFAQVSCSLKEKVGLQDGTALAHLRVGADTMQRHDVGPPRCTPCVARAPR